MKTKPVNMNRKRIIAVKRMEVQEASNGDLYLLFISHRGDEKPLFHIKLGIGMPEDLIEEA